MSVHHLFHTKKDAYVYELIDPRDGKVFYVGKGRNSRAWAHEKAARRGKVHNAFKTALIMEIIGFKSSLLMVLS